MHHKEGKFLVVFNLEIGSSKKGNHAILKKKTPKKTNKTYHN
jgi:hypothetical protein